MKDVIKVEKEIIKDVVSTIVLLCPYLIQPYPSKLKKHYLFLWLSFHCQQEEVEEEIVEVEKEIVSDVKKIFGGQGR